MVVTHAARWVNELIKITDYLKITDLNTAGQSFGIAFLGKQKRHALMRPTLLFYSV